MSQGSLAAIARDGAARIWAVGPRDGVIARLEPARLAIVVPTFNERENIAELFARVGAAMGAAPWEMIVVDDDSPDGTAEAARALHRLDGRIRVLRRIGRRGLSSACIEGLLSSSAPFLAVMDADLQHDPALLPLMLRALEGGSADLVVASRYAAGGELGEWDARRAAVSRLATDFTRRISGVCLTDPMSGYFALRREVLDETVRGLSGRGFKILLDLVLTVQRPLRIQELPLKFGVRRHGRSKLNSGVVWQWLALLIRKTVARRLSGWGQPGRRLSRRG
ncbi:MAG TPA: polyprenol monophosphomannose synthase [Caulobacteraceae bacterium]